MKMHHAIAVALCGVPCIAHAARAQTATWSSVDSILGRSGPPQAGDVMRYGFPRGDLSVTANGVKLKPAFALGSWVAFKRGESHAMAMGDLVLTETEIAPVMKELQSGGVMQTALHNHVLGESPRIMYMHIEAHGDERAIAGTIRRALEDEVVHVRRRLQHDPRVRLAPRRTDAELRLLAAHR